MVVEDCNCESVENSVLEDLLDANPSLLHMRAARVAKVTRFLRSDEINRKIDVR
jgi:hypothetical protein